MAGTEWEKEIGKGETAEGEVETRAADSKGRRNVKG
jgi:hypothetical protein